MYTCIYIHTLLLVAVYPVGSEVYLQDQSSPPKVPRTTLRSRKDSLDASKFILEQLFARAQEPARPAYVSKFLEQSRRERAASQCTKGYAGPLRPGRRGPKGSWALGPANFWGAARQLSKSKNGLRCLLAGSYRW